MCGIAGTVLNDKDRIDPVWLAKRLLLGIEHRGKDATGIAFRTPRGGIHVAKKNIPATQFIAKHFPVGPRAKSILVHTRMATQGSPTDNNNNHPIVSGSLVGVHNGMIWNDDYLFNVSKAPRIGEVDSEAIFAALAYGQQNVTDTLAEVEGSAAIAWMDRAKDEGSMEIARISQSPVHWLITKNGSFLFASESDILDGILEAANWLKVGSRGNLPEGTYLNIENGSVKDSLKFEPSDNWLNYRSPYGGTITYPRQDFSAQITRGGSYGGLLGAQKELPAAKVDPPKEDEVVLDTDEFDPLYTMGILTTDLFDPDMSVAPVIGTKYLEYYKERSENVYAWLKKLHKERKTTVDDAATLTVTYEQKNLYRGNVRPGDWVKTDLAGQEVNGQVYELPLTFPFGEYILRVYVNNAVRKTYECVYITRYFDEFEGIDVNA